MADLPQEKPRILLLTAYYPAHRGGVEIVAGKIVEHLLENYPVAISWIASDVDPAPADRPQLSCLPAGCWNFIENLTGIPYPIWGISALRQIWKATRAATIVHLHDYLYAGNLAAFVFARVQKKPVILTQHIGFIPYKNLFARYLLSFLNRTLGKVLLARTDQTIFISEVVRDYFANRIPSGKEHVTIPNGVDPRIFHSVPEEERQRIRHEFGFPAGMVFLFVGRFVEKKGLLILKQLAFRFPSIHWAFAGWGPLDPASWQLPNVSVWRGRSGEQIADLYRAADLVILPSRGEGFPLVVQEAMACGTLVLLGEETARASTEAGPWLLTARVDQNESDVVNIWTEKIKTLMENSDWMTPRSGVESFARRHWNWDACASAYWEIFQSVLRKQDTQ